MRSFTHPWNLRRIFGSQSVGCASSRSWPEAGIATRIIPAQSSRRVFRRPSDANLATWRPGDLATWRPGDLATWRLGDLATWRLGDLATWRLGESDHRGYRPSYSPPATAEAFRPPSTQISRDLLEADLPDHTSPSQGSAIIRTSPTVLPLGTNINYTEHKNRLLKKQFIKQLKTYEINNNKESSL